MRFLIVNTYYQDLVEGVYREHPELVEQPFDVQYHTWMDGLYGSSDWYSHGLRELGHEAKDLVLNIEPLQRQWARERGVDTLRSEWRIWMRKGIVPWPYRYRRDDWMWATLMAQVRDYRPDVLYIQAIKAVGPEFLRRVRPYVRMIVGQHASPIGPVTIRGYDLVLSSLPNQVDEFRAMGLRAEYLKLGFEPRACDRIRDNGRPLDVVFVGGLGGHHERGTGALEQLARKLPVTIWGYGEANLSADSPLQGKCRGPLWGVKYYQTLRDAKIVFNRHIGVAEQYANNLRLYEATGVGTMLLTDNKSNLADLFTPGKEVVAYDSPDDAVEKASYYLARADQREAIAAAGQKRTLGEHTWGHRMREMVDIVKRFI